MSAIAGLVLAGGRSSRMGRDKALLTLAGETLLARNCRQLQQAGCARVFISGEHRAGAAIDNDSIRAIPDLTADQGPVGGILSVMEQLQGNYDWLLIIAVDMPRLTAEELRPLLHNLDAAGAGRYVADSHFPLLLAISDAHINTIREQLESDTKRGRSLYRLLKNLGVSEWQMAADEGQYINVNTPEQWQDCLDQHNAPEGKTFNS